MRKLFSVFLLVLFTQVAFAQQLTEADKKNINERLDIFMDLTTSSDFSGMMDYTYPKLFDFASKEQMVELMNGLSDLGIKLEFDEAQVNSVEALHEQEDKKFALAGYSAKLRVVLTTLEMQQPEVVTEMMSAFEGQYGSESSYDSNTHTISVAGNRHIVCIQDAKYGNDWYFIEYNPTESAMMQTLLSSDVMTKIEAKIK